jgi:hypothetical protein
MLTGLVLILTGYQAVNTVAGLWRVWPAAEEVQFVWQAALTQAADYLDSSPVASPVAVGGWTPDTMDEPTMTLTLRRDDLSLRYFDPSESLILPGGANRQPTARMVRPRILPLAPSLESIAGVPTYLPAGASPGQQFALHESMTLPTDQPEYRFENDFGGQLRFLGYDLEGNCQDDAPCGLVTYWQVLDEADGPRRIFLHRIDDGGHIIGQDDRLGVPAKFWQPGDIIIQLLTIPPGEGALSLGVYNPETEQRLLSHDGDALPLPAPGS